MDKRSTSQPGKPSPREDPKESATLSFLLSSVLSDLLARSRNNVPVVPWPLMRRTGTRLARSSSSLLTRPSHRYCVVVIIGCLIDLLGFRSPRLSCLRSPSVCSFRPPNLLLSASLRPLRIFTLLNVHFIISIIIYLSLVKRYEFLTQAFTIYEEEMVDSKVQFSAIILVIGTLQTLTCFSDEKYDFLIRLILFCFLGVR